jgi:hypothetical protein
MPATILASSEPNESGIQWLIDPDQKLHFEVGEVSDENLFKGRDG